MPYWCCAQVAPQQERAAQHFLKLNGYESYCPRLRVIRRSSWAEDRDPAVLVSELSVRRCCCRLVVGEMVSLREPDHPQWATPAVVADSIIDEIKSRERGGAVELPDRNGLKPGDKVRVLAGPLQGQLGLYAGQRPHERVLVLLALLGGQQRVELPRDAVEVV